MKNTLIALATAGLLASGGASAGTTNVQVNRSAIAPVQYSSQYSDRLKRGLDQLAANVRVQLRDDDHRRS